MIEFVGRHAAWLLRVLNQPIQFRQQLPLLPLDRADLRRERRTVRGRLLQTAAGRFFVEVVRPFSPQFAQFRGDIRLRRGWPVRETRA